MVSYIQKPCITNIFIHFYRLQTKFAKVMFSQVSVCPQVGGVQVQAQEDVYPSLH